MNKQKGRRSGKNKRTGKYVLQASRTADNKRRQAKRRELGKARAAKARADRRAA